MDQLVGWSRGDHGGPVWERFLQEGFVVAVADYRGGPANVMNTPSSTGLITAIDDGITVVDYVQHLAYVDRSNVSVYGVSLGGNLALYLASRVPTLHAVVAVRQRPSGSGVSIGADGSAPGFATAKPDPATCRKTSHRSRTGAHHRGHRGSPDHAQPCDGW
jgi:acetyl esterase/lipase